MAEQLKLWASVLLDWTCICIVWIQSELLCVTVCCTFGSWSVIYFPWEQLHLKVTLWRLIKLAARFIICAVNQWCTRRQCRGSKRIPKSFDVSKIRATSLKIWCPTLFNFKKRRPTFAENTWPFLEVTLKKIFKGGNL